MRRDQWCVVRSLLFYHHGVYAKTVFCADNIIQCVEKQVECNCRFENESSEHFIC